MKNKINKFIKLSIVIGSLAPFCIVGSGTSKRFRRIYTDNNEYYSSFCNTTYFYFSFCFFVWGVVQYVLNDADEAKKKKVNHLWFGVL